MTKWDAHVEANGHHDLVFRAPNELEKLLAVFEMKRWMSPSGDPEILGIRNDVSKLRQLAGPAGFLILFSANPINSTEEQLSFLEKDVFDGVSGPRELYRFETVNQEGKRCEFWVAGWHVNANSSG